MKRVHLALMVVALMVTAVPGLCQGLKKINVGMQPIVNGPLHIAVREKYFEQLGLEVNLVKFTAGPPQFAALAGGQIDLAWGGMGAFLLAKANGQDLNFFAVFMDVNAVEGIAVPPGSQIGSVKALAGKKVALVQGSDAHYGMLKALNRNGMDRGAIQILNMLPPQQVAALTSKDVDAIFSWEPFLTPLTQNGARVIFRNSELDPGPAFLGWAGKRAWLMANQEAVTNILKGWNMGLKKMQENPELAIRYSMDWSGMNETQARTFQKQVEYFDATAALDPQHPAYWAKGSKLNGMLHDFLAFGKEYKLVKSDARIDVDSYVMTELMQAAKRGK